jgi:hypothetical protein
MGHTDVLQALRLVVKQSCNNDIPERRHFLVVMEGSDVPGVRKAVDHALDSLVARMVKLSMTEVKLIIAQHHCKPLMDILLLIFTSPYIQRSWEFMSEALGLLVQSKYKPHDRHSALMASLMHLHQNEMILASSESLAEFLENLGYMPQLRGALSSDWLILASKVTFCWR